MVDIWSLGCILAEMLYCSKENQISDFDCMNRFPFKGGHCFPMSPDKHSNNILSEEDQMTKICEKIPFSDKCD